MTRRRLFASIGALLLTTLLLTTFVFRERVLYLASAATYQGQMLWGRVPVQEAIDSGRFNEKQLERLRQVGGIKTFGRSIGLEATANYDTINPSWNHTIYNMSAAEEVRFVNVRWWFPIVGSMPYLGYFEQDVANAKAEELREQGYDTHVRTAGAYSTLGWFEDPLLPRMLDWSEYSFANTILHELAHATVWIPGSVPFNESFANFVGDVAARRYMTEKYGPDSTEVAEMTARIADRAVYRAAMHALYKDLDAVYTNADLSKAEKVVEKAALFSGLPERMRTQGFSDPDRWVKWVERGTWNNATMMQFRTYNTSRDRFQALFDAEGGDLLAFMRRVQTVTKGADDPYAALKAAAEKHAP